MFGKKENLIGVDIGSNSVKVLELKRKNDGYVLSNISHQELPADVISEGTIVDYGEVVNSIVEIFKNNKFSHKKVAAALKGNAVIAKRLTVASIDAKNFDEVFRWEAEQYIQMDINEVNIDYEILNKDQEVDQADVLLAVARKDLIADMNSVLESAKLKPELIDLEVFSLINAFEMGYGTDSDITSIINIGHSSLLILFIKNGLYEFSRETNFGVKDCVELIQQRLNVNEKEATAMLMDEEAVEFNEELQGVFDEFGNQLASEIKSTFDMFYTSSHQNVLKCYICGGGSNLYNVKENISKQTSLDVNYFNPFTNIEVDKKVDLDYLNQNMYLFNVAVGLALRKAGDK